MAKEDMICPFSGKLCRECALYRGRHYYLCFSKKYRGHLEKPGGDDRKSNPGTSGVEPVKQIRVPVKMSNAIDPFTRPLADVNERTGGIVNEA